MKKTLAIMAFFMAISVASQAEPNDKVLKAFVTAFPNVSAVQWGGTTTQPVAYFKEGNIQSRVYFDKDGNFIQSLRYYSENELPVNIIFAMKKKYQGASVTGVTEIADAEGHITYYIKLNDTKYWWTLKTTTGATFDVTEKYKMQVEG